MAYRASGRKTGVYVLRAPAPPHYLFAILMLATAGLGVALALSFGMTIDCSRKAGTCVMSEVVGPNVPYSQTTLPLSSIKNVGLLPVPGQQGDAIGIQHDGRIEFFGASDRFERSEKRGTAIAMSAYLITPAREGFQDDLSYSGPFWIWVAAMVVALALVFVSRTTIVVDHAAGVLRLMTSLLGRYVEVPLADIETTTLDAKVDDDGATVTAPAIVRKDGSVFYLRPHSRAEPKLKRKLLADVTAALDLSA